MRLPTRIHGVLDYLIGALLVGAPWLFGFAAGGAETWVPVAAGVLVVLYSLFTDYELGAVRRIDVPVHLFMDAILGILLAVSPWVLGFDTVAYLPHLVLGLVSVATAAVTDTIPGYERRRTAR